MTVKKLIPCSPYDIPGIQSWLDEMALQGLFLKEFTPRWDRAVFELGDPKPMRYRLDPISRNIEKDREREEPYAQMGWTFVDYIPHRFYVFSCDDPEVPELYTDPQSLAMAMGDLIRREIRNTLLLISGIALTSAILLFWGWRPILRNLILWEDPRELVSLSLALLVLVVCCIAAAVQTRNLLKKRDTLAQGLPLKARRRWNRPQWFVPWFFVYFLTMCLITFLPRLLLPPVGWEIFDLDEVELAHLWPSIVQTEAPGPRPLEAEPKADGYITANSSWLAPVQQTVETEWGLYGPGHVNQYRTSIEYIQARSPGAARLIFRVELDHAAQSLNRWTEWNGYLHIDNLQPFQPQSRPGLDRLEVSRYTRWGRDCWSIAALRGTDILVVEYIGYASWEDCLPLFLAALDQ